MPIDTLKLRQFADTIDQLENAAKVRRLSGGGLRYVQINVGHTTEVHGVKVPPVRLTASIASGEENQATGIIDLVISALKERVTEQSKELDIKSHKQTQDGGKV